MKRAETCSCSFCNKFYTYLYHHIVVLDKYTHSNLVYYKHKGDEEPCEVTTSSPRHIVHHELTYVNGEVYGNATVNSALKEEIMWRDCVLCAFLSSWNKS